MSYICKSDDEDLSQSMTRLNLKSTDDVLRRSTRSKQLTEKARDNAVIELEKRKEKLLKRIKNKKKNIDDLLYSTDNEVTVKEELHQLNDIFAMLEDISQAAFKLDENEHWFEFEEEAMCEYKHKIYNWLKMVSQNRNSETRSKHSRKSSCSSRLSSRSNRSSRSERAIEDKKKLRELEVSSTYLEKKAEMKILAEKIEMEEQIAKLKARVKVDEEEDSKEIKPLNYDINMKDDDAKSTNVTVAEEITKMQTSYSEKAKPSASNEHFMSIQQESSLEPALSATKQNEFKGISNYSRETHNTFPLLKIPQRSYEQSLQRDGEEKTRSSTEIRNKTVISANPSKLSDFIVKETNSHQQVNPKIISRNISETESSNEDISNNLYKLLKSQSAPEVELETFSGNPMEFEYFMAMFHEVVEKRVDDQIGRLTRLLKFTEGEPRELIRHCIQQSRDKCYDTAKDLLKRQYGNPHRILSAYKDEIANLQTIRPNDVASLKKLFMFLLKVNGLNLGVSTNPLDNSDTICRVLSRLPVYLQDRWSRNVHSMRKLQQREPSLRDLILLIEDEMTISDDPLFSRGAVNKYRDKVERTKEQSRRSMKSFASEIERKSDNKQCPVCKSEKHTIEACEEYLRLNLDERSRKVFKCRLCFKCLKPVDNNHTASSCNQPLKCIVCYRNHPTSLHGFRKVKEQSHVVKDKADSEQPVLSALTRSSTDTISLCVVRIEVTHPTTSKVIPTYAMLDSCSQGSFITKDLAEKLSLKGRRTSLSVKTVNGDKEHQTTAIDDLKVRKGGLDNQWINVSKAYTQEEIPINSNDVASFHQVQNWDHLIDVVKDIHTHGDIKVDVLIGANCPRALEPLKFVHSQNGGPYAVKTRLGWCVVGPVERKSSSENEKITTNRITYKEGITKPFEECDAKRMIIDMYNNDFIENNLNSQAHQNLSGEDKRFLKIVEEGTYIVDGKYQVPLPFKHENVTMSNNRYQAQKRFVNLEKKFAKNEEFKSLYFKAMNEMFNKGYAEKASEAESGQNWYIPHHGVSHPAKPNKLRIVFDASAEYDNCCINRELLKGPDLTNQLIGVLIRFREEKIAITADIEGMFFQVKLPEGQRSFFKFLWYTNNDPRKGIRDFQMTSHIFGGASSPSCSNFALRKTAKDNEDHFSHEVTNALIRNFYVDDLLKSIASEQDSIKFVKEVKDLCLRGGFNLTKFSSSKPQVLAELSLQDRKNESTGKGLLNDSPEQSTLGMIWNPTDDSLRFKLSKEVKPLTRRGILSTISSIYDPLGLIGPYILKGKSILQKLCKENVTWDESIPSNIAKEWELWRHSLHDIEKVKVIRCLKPSDSITINDTTLHIFSDASDGGYGIACYVRFVNENKKVTCNLVYGRSRVNPIKYVSIPRMELSASLLAAKTGQLLLKEFDIPIGKVYFWTDSKVVLAYLKNESRAFKTFVANRVQQIHDLCDVDMWNYVSSKENPADHASRGFSANQTKKVEQWFRGPSFLWKKDLTFETNASVVNLDDVELKVTQCVNLIEQNNSLITTLVRLTNDWVKMTKIVAYIRKFIKNIRSRIQNKMQGVENVSKTHTPCINVQDVEEAKIAIFQMLHREIYKTEINEITKFEATRKSSRLQSLNPILVEGVLRVGGRLSNSELPYHQKHPIILPKDHLISEIIIRHYHQRCAHGGRNATINFIRQSGFWIVNCTSLVKKFVSKCVTCRKLFRKCEQPFMGDLPKDRTMISPPFTHIGVDLFGPIYIKERRSILKRYGVLFTCLNLRSVHIEVASSLSTDSFILALRRFVGRRGNVQTIRSDNGTNFVGAAKELTDAFKEMDEETIKTYLLRENIDWISWKRNPPYASHMGGVWERQIRSIRRVLSVLMNNHKEILNEESLYTLMVEVEAIINSRPLTVENINNPDILPLAPANILNMKSDVIQSLPGVFPSADEYSRKQWRRVQYLANQFWRRWQKEYLSTLQVRSKWNKEVRNLQIGDIVLIKEENERREWPMGRVIAVEKDKNGTVRSVTLKIRRSNNKRHEYLKRPVTKTVLLVESMSDSPTEEPSDQN